MRLSYVMVVFAFLITSANAGMIGASGAAAHIGQTATVEGTVSEVHTAQSGKATFIDMDGNYPNEAFTAVIFAENMTSVGDVSDLTGKKVDITGTIQSYRGRPEIIVRSRDQIRVK
jgi:DNA/RNA endonuclease YhcR with UshA esterase domain